MKTATLKKTELCLSVRDNVRARIPEMIVRGRICVRAKSTVSVPGRRCCSTADPRREDPSDAQDNQAGRKSMRKPL